MNTENKGGGRFFPGRAGQRYNTRGLENTKAKVPSVGEKPILAVLGHWIKFNYLSYLLPTTLS